MGENSKKIIKREEVEIITESDFKGNRFLRTNYPAIDLMLSKGAGLIRGVAHEISSPTGLGKTTMIASIVRELILSGLKVVWIDTEEGLSDDLMKRMNLDKTRFNYQLVMTHKEAEKVLMQEKGKCDVVVLDSITALIPDIKLQKKVGSAPLAIKAVYDGELLDKFRYFAKKNMFAMVYINQIRNKINLKNPYGSGPKPAGGNAQSFAMEIRVEMNPYKVIEAEATELGKVKNIRAGIIAKAKVTKGRWSDNYINYLIPIRYGMGISKVMMADLLLDGLGIYINQGSWFIIKFDGKEEKVQGLNGRLKWVLDNIEKINEYIYQLPYERFIKIDDFSSYKRDEKEDEEGAQDED